MFNTIIVAKCDICSRNFTWKPEAFVINAPIRIKVPDYWRLFSVSGKDMMYQVLICDDHSQDRLRDIIDLMEKPPVVLAQPPDNAPT